MKPTALLQRTAHKIAVDPSAVLSAPSSRVVGESSRVCRVVCRFWGRLLELARAARCPTKATDGRRVRVPWRGRGRCVGLASWSSVIAHAVLCSVHCSWCCICLFRLASQVLRTGILILILIIQEKRLNHFTRPTGQLAATTGEWTDSTNGSEVQKREAAVTRV